MNERDEELFEFIKYKDHLNQVSNGIDIEMPLDLKICDEVMNFLNLKLHKKSTKRGKDFYFMLEQIRAIVFESGILTDETKHFFELQIGKRERRICEICGEKFTALREEEKVICGTCQKKKGYPLRACEICGKMFSPKNDTKKTCSPECKKEKSVIYQRLYKLNRREEERKKQC
jgi:hypothetical protein